MVAWVASFLSSSQRHRGTLESITASLLMERDLRTRAPQQELDAQECHSTANNSPIRHKSDNWPALPRVRHRSRARAAMVAWSFLNSQQTPLRRRFFFFAAAPNHVLIAPPHRGDPFIRLRERDAEEHMRRWTFSPASRVLLLLCRDHHCLDQYTPCCNPGSHKGSSRALRFSVAQAGNSLGTGHGTAVSPVWERCILRASTIGRRDGAPDSTSTSDPHLALLALVREFDVPSQLQMPRANPCRWLSELLKSGTGPDARRRRQLQIIAVNYRAQQLFIQSDGAVPWLSSLSYAVAAATRPRYPLLLVREAHCTLLQVALKQTRVEAPR
jgi:hypothetical protein